MDCVRGPIPQKDQMMNPPLDTGKTRSNKPAWTPLESTGKTEIRSISRNEVSAVVEAGRAEIVLSKPSRCQAADMTVKGTKMDTRASIRYRCCDCGTQMMTGHHFVMTEDKDMEPMKMDCDPIKGETVLVRPMTFLDVPATRLTGGFLKLAEEARHSEGVDDQPPRMNIVNLKQSGWTGRILIEEIEGGSPGSGSEESGGSRISTEVIPDGSIAKPAIRRGPVGQNLRRMGNTNVMAKPDPVGLYEERDNSVSRMTDGPAGLVRTRRPVGPYEDKDISVSPVTDGPAGLVRTRRPVGSDEDEDLSVSPVTDGPAGLVRTRRPVGSYEDKDVSVSPVTDGPAGLVRTRRPVGQYEDRNISVSPVTDGPAGLVRTRRPVGDMMLPTLQDEVRPSAGGLMGQIPDPCVQSGPTKNESAMNMECLPPVIEPKGEALRGRMRPAVDMKRMEPSEVKGSLEVHSNTAEGNSVRPSINQDPTIRTGPADQTNNMKLDMKKERSDLSVVSPSSDSGVHSVDGQGDGMSTYAGESDSIQSVKTVYGSVICQTDRPVVKLTIMNSTEVMDTLEERHGNEDSVPSVSTTGHKSDIADLGDFSDEEEGQWEEVEPSEDVQTDVRTECVVKDHMSFLSTIGHNSDIADMGDFSDEENEQWEEVETSEDVQTEVRENDVVNNASNSCERSELPNNPAVVIPHCMEIHDEDYWTNFRSQAKQAFKLDNVALASSNFPIAVKELVIKSRVTMQDINDRAEREYEEEQEWEAAGKTVEPNFWHNNTDRLEDFTIPISDWWQRRKTDVEEISKMFEIADNVDVCPDPDARAKFDLSPTREDGVDVCSDPDARARFVLSPNKIDVCPDPDARAKFELSPTLEDGFDMCSEPDARAKFELSPTMEDGVEVCSDPVVRSVHKSDYMSDPGRKPESQEGCSGGPTITRRQYNSPSEVHGIDHPVNNKRSVYTSTGPMGFQVTLAGHITDWPDLVVPAGTMKQTDVSEMLYGNRWDDDMASRSGTSENPDDCSGDRNGAETTYDESDKLAGEWDPLVKQDIGCQLVHVNKGRNDCVTNLRDLGGSSDSGVQSWTEQWENMSDNSMDDSYVDTGDLHRSVSSELARLLYDAPPNTGDEDASGSPGTDGSGTGVLPRSWPEEIFDDDRNLSKDDKTDSEYDSNSEEIFADERNLSNDDKTDSEYDSNSDLEGYSDFSDDSSVLGVRKVLRCRVPYRGRAPWPRKGCARAPRTPPVPPRNRAEQEVLEHNSVRSSWRRWSYGWVPEYTDEAFLPFVRKKMVIKWTGRERAHMDHVLPKLVQSLVIAARVVRKVPDCQENHRMRRDLMLRLFDEEMEKSYLGWERFPVRNRMHIAALVEATPSVGSALDEVRETFTPPIRRRGCRKGVTLRKCLSDTERS